MGFTESKLGVYGVEKDGIRYDKFPLVKTKRLPEKYYRKEFGIEQDKVKSSTVYIEKRVHPKTRNFCYIAVIQFYNDAQKSRPSSLAVEWILFREYSRLVGLC